MTSRARRRVERSWKASPTAACLALLWAWGSPAVVVEAAEDTFSEAVNVELVNVEVWVTDAEGRHVPGLQASDFRILQDGDPVTLSHFTEARRDGVVHGRFAGSEAPAASRAEATSGADPSAPLILYFDQSRLHPESYGRVLDGVEAMLASGVDASEVLVLRQDRSLSVAAPLGSTRKELETALGRIAEPPASGAQAGADLRQAIDAVRRVFRESENAAGSGGTGLGGVPASLPSGTSPRAAIGGGSGSIMPGPCDLFGKRVEPVLWGYVRQRGAEISATLSGLEAAGTLLAGLPGVKTMVYFGDNLETRPGVALAQFAAGFCPAYDQQLQISTLGEQLSRDYLSLTRRLNSRRITLHSFQGKGLRSNDSGSASGRGGSLREVRSGFDAAQRTSERSGLAVLADETGGRAVFGQNDLGAELVKVVEDMGSYYSLAFSPPDPDRPERERIGRREHRIDVELPGHDHTLRYRHGYQRLDADQRMGEWLEGALALGLSENSLGVRLGAEQRTAHEGGGQVRLYVVLPAESLALLPQGESVVGQVRVHVRTRGLATGEGVDQSKTFDLQLASGGAGDQVRLPVNLELAAGNHAVAVGIRDLRSTATSFVSTTLGVAAKAADG
ncbi:MAG: VWA domain-containing protein [Acidobacteriota bacterium]